MVERKQVRYPVPVEAIGQDSKCRSCGAPVFWIVTAAGKRMPLSVASTDAEGTALSHFADCPNANTHRKPKDPKP